MCPGLLIAHARLGASCPLQCSVPTQREAACGGSCQRRRRRQTARARLLTWITWERRWRRSWHGALLSVRACIDDGLLLRTSAADLRQSSTLLLLLCFLSWPQSYRTFALALFAGRIHPHTLEPYPVAPPSSTQPQQAAHQPSQPQQPTQPQPSITGRRQLGPWVAAGKAQQHQQGLGPSQPLPQPMLQRLQRQWEGVAPRQGSQGQQVGTDVSDVLQSYQPPAASQQQQQAGRAGWLQPAQAVQQQRTVNMFARQQQQQPQQQRQQQQAQQQPALLSQPPQQSQATTCGGSSMQEVATAVQPSQAAEASSGQQEGRAQPLQPITNQVRQQDQQDAAVCASTSASATSSQAQLWDRAEQYRPSPQVQQSQQQQQRQQGRGTPPAAAASSKRKSSGGGGSSSKKAAKPLAPPAQRISRFFAPAPKQQ